MKFLQLLPLALLFCFVSVLAAQEITEDNKKVENSEEDAPTQVVDITDEYLESLPDANTLELVTEKSLADREDQSFLPFFSLENLRKAVKSGDAELMTDTALGLEHAERVFSRKHKSGVESSALVLFTLKYLKVTGDVDQTMRIVDYGKKHKKLLWEELASSSRSSAESFKKRVEAVESAFDEEALTGIEISPHVLAIEEAMSLPIASSRSGDEEIEEAELKAPNPTLSLIEEFTGSSRANYIGQKRTLNVARCRARCKNTGSDIDTKIYQPGPGWVITSYKLVKGHAHGHGLRGNVYKVNGTASHTPNSYIRNIYAGLLDYANKRGQGRYKSNIGKECDQHISRMGKYTHFGLKNVACCRGEGLFKGGGKYESHISVTIAYIGDYSFYKDRESKWKYKINASSSSGSSQSGTPYSKKSIVTICNRAKCNINYTIRCDGSSSPQTTIYPGETRFHVLDDRTATVVFDGGGGSNYKNYKVVGRSYSGGTANASKGNPYTFLSAFGRIHMKTGY